MDNKLIETLWAIAPAHNAHPPKLMSPKDMYADSCKSAILSLRQAVDHGWLFINYLRREDKSKGEKYGVAVSFFIDGKLYAGQSVCMRAPAMPSNKEFANAAKILSASYDGYVTGPMLRQAYKAKQAEDAPVYDEWRRHIGIWKAVEAARQVDLKDAMELSIHVEERFKQLRASSSVRLFKMANVVAYVAHHNDLPSFTNWLVGDDEDNPIVPYRAQGAVVGAIVAAMNNKLKRDLDTIAAAAAQTPASV